MDGVQTLSPMAKGAVDRAKRRGRGVKATKATRDDDLQQVQVTIIGVLASVLEGTKWQSRQSLTFRRSALIKG